MLSGGPTSVGRRWVTSITPELLLLLGDADPPRGGVLVWLHFNQRYQAGLSFLPIY